MARLLDSVLGHDNVIEPFLLALNQKRLPNTFLFVGANGIGKCLVAQALAQVLLCANSGCGQCPSCLRVAKDQHESLRILRPEKQVIKIEQTRSILDFLSYRSLTEHRVVIIDEADKLNPQAANSLLKILEEPNPNTFFFLIAPSPSHVLVTLRSRAQIMSFRPLTIAELKEKSPAPDWVLRAAQGSFERVKSFSDADEMAARGQALRFLQCWGKDPYAYLETEFRNIFRDKAAALSLAQQLVFLLRDAVLWQWGERQNLFNPDQVSLFQDLVAQTSGARTLQRAVQLATQLEVGLQQHRDSQLLFEEFWIQSLQL